MKYLIALVCLLAIPSSVSAQVTREVDCDFGRYSTVYSGTHPTSAFWACTGARTQCFLDGGVPGLFCRTPVILPPYAMPAEAQTMLAVEGNACGGCLPATTIPQAKPCPAPAPFDPCQTSYQVACTVNGVTVTICASSSNEATNICTNNLAGVAGVKSSFNGPCPIAPFFGGGSCIPSTTPGCHSYTPYLQNYTVNCNVNGNIVSVCAPSASQATNICRNNLAGVPGIPQAFNGPCPIPFVSANCCPAPKKRCRIFGRFRR